MWRVEGIRASCLIMGVVRVLCYLRHVVPSLLLLPHTRAKSYQRLSKWCLLLPPCEMTWLVGAETVLFNRVECHLWCLLHDTLVLPVVYWRPCHEKQYMNTHWRGWRCRVHPGSGHNQDFLKGSCHFLSWYFSIHRQSNDWFTCTSTMTHPGGLACLWEVSLKEWSKSALQQRFTWHAF